MIDSDDITPVSTYSAVRAAVLAFIVTDADGSQKVDTVAMNDWLASQFGPVDGAGSYDTLLGKNAEGYNIVQSLQSVVGRERWARHPAFPGQSLPDGAVATNRLIDLRDKLQAEGNAIESSYNAFMAGLVTRAKALFTSMVAPGFPKGETAIDSTRFYVETFVTDRGEESAPSPVSTAITVNQSQSATITASAPPSGRFIAKRRLYRSATGTALAAYKLQGEYPIATTVIVDAVKDENLNDVLATTGWLEPPAGLLGLTGMPNGIMVGFVGSTLYACEPYAPYAWPAKYDKPLAHRIVGTVAVGQSVFVATNARPYLISGTDSASLSEQIISSKVPCVSARSMVAIGNSVFYAAADGLALYENGDVNIVTKDLIDRAKWNSYRPATMKAAEFNGRYVAVFTRADLSQGALMFDYHARTFCELDQAADAVYADEAGLYALIGTAVYDVFPAAGAGRAANFYSKTFRLVKPQSFGWMQVDAEFSGGATVTVRLYADGVLHTTAVVADSKPRRVAPGRPVEWRVEIDSAIRINGLALATTTEELKAIL